MKYIIGGVILLIALILLLDYSIGLKKNSNFPATVPVTKIFETSSTL
jgi:hypothetical protein